MHSAQLDMVVRIIENKTLVGRCHEFRCAIEPV